jgi:pilus assembly protein Flp/PilA
MEKMNEVVLSAYLSAVRALTDRKGVTAVEYGLIAGLIAVAIIAILQSLGGNLSSLFGKVNTSIANAAA